MDSLDLLRSDFGDVGLGLRGSVIGTKVQRSRDQDPKP